MNTKLLRSMLFCVLSLFAFQQAHAADDEWPFKEGNYWEVTGIKVADGAGLKYANWLASEWRKNLEFALSEGWLESYYVISNVHARADEPDLYLVRIFKNMATAEENEKRQEKYMAWVKKSIEKMQSESGDRAEYRTIMSTSLLQELHFRDK
ncbi:hypothetical protein [Thalassotalea mangrovi]|uniref:Uncharacterized protein n=1 Tax=Thalassotalea mangrovi TaxID=2572245 RepID=A0A4U1BBT2_9GAMM|nr:hypothetical protein [Thalassotalea mangrovi]TKB47479.1 hypothetical protein E8M12_01465 [Thalassotalea mangrovi]